MNGGGVNWTLNWPLVLGVPLSFTFSPPKFNFTAAPQVLNLNEQEEDEEQEEEGGAEQAAK